MPGKLHQFLIGRQTHTLTDAAKNNDALPNSMASAKANTDETTQNK